MKDRYPELATIPADSLVPPELQPDYVDLPGRRLPEEANAGRTIALRPGWGSKLAVIHHEGRQQLTFSDLALASGRLANVLAEKGVRPGERVAFRSPNRPEMLIISLACWRLGAVVVPTPLQARSSELKFALEDTGAVALIAFGGAPFFDDVPTAVDGTAVRIRIVFGQRPDISTWLWWDELMQDASANFEDRHTNADLPALIWHTGGTTGVPKACYHTHRRFLGAGYSFPSGTGITEGQRWAAAAPVGHALGFIYHTIFTLLHGATVVMIEDFANPRVILQAIAEHQIGTFTAIAATWARMRDAIVTEPRLGVLPSLRHGYAMWQSASSSEVYDWWKERNIVLLNNFGSTAFANWILVPKPGQSVRRASLGRPTPGYEVVATDPEAHQVVPLPAGQTGRMAVRGPSGLTYWNRPEAQVRDVLDGWTLVDDLIQFDENGNASYLGRTDFVISSAGYKIAPVEVEQVLAEHAAVKEVSVVGTPDAVRQEIVTAFVVVQPGVKPDNDLRIELQAFVKSKLAPFKYPRRIEFIDSLPRDAVGKVQPRALKEMAVNLPTDGAS